MIKGRSSFTSSSRVKDVANRLNLEKKSNEDSPALVHWTLVLVTRIVSQVIVSTSAGYFEREGGRLQDQLVTIGSAERSSGSLVLIFKLFGTFQSPNLQEFGMLPQCHSATD